MSRNRRNIKQARGSQISRAENLRDMLLNHHNLTGREAKKFENIVKGMSATDLTNLSRQYHGILEVWQDSDGVSAAISQDFIKRVMAIQGGRLKSAVQTVLNRKDGGTKLNRKIGDYISPRKTGANLYDTPREETLEHLGLNPKKRSVKREGVIKIAGKYRPLGAPIDL